MIHPRLRYALPRPRRCATLFFAALALAGASSGVAGASPRVPGASSATTAARVASQPRAKYVIDVFQGQLVQPMLTYRVYVHGLLSALNTQLATLLVAEQDGNLTGAQTDWLPAHLTWLQIGQDDGAYGAFGALGGMIDGLAGGLSGGATNPNFTGFHRVEFDLWTDHDTTAAAADTVRLQGLVSRLESAGLAKELPTSIASVSAWVLRCHEILEDADRDSLTAYDDYGSGTDLESVGADVTATREMLTLLEPVVHPRDPKLIGIARARLRAVERAINAAIGSAQPLPITDLPTAERERVDAAVGSALETLAPISDLIHVAGDTT
jgi:high-affinity iron transporter